MRINRFLAALAIAVTVGASQLAAQSASGRTEELASSMARVGVERVFTAYAVDYGSLVYGAWVHGYDLYVEQFHKGQFEIISVDLRTGERKWVAPIGGCMLKVAPYPGERYVAFLTEGNGGLVTINRATGAHDFRLRTEVLTPTSFPAPSSESSVFMINLGSNQLVAINPASGQVGWRFPVESLMTAGPVLTPRLPRRLLVAGCVDGTVVAVPAQGHHEAPPTVPAWSQRLFAAVNALVVAEGLDQGRRTVSIIASCEDRGVYCLDSASGEPRWVARTENPVKAPAIVSGGTVFARSGRLIAVDLATGKEKWKAGEANSPAPWERATAGLAADANRAYLRKDPKEICRVDAKTGVFQACARLNEFDWVLAAPEANMIVGVTSDGYVVAYR
jgi:outer membrane protein assembly factor BamB